ncbi:hypothetical protein PCANC_25344 [Puccinia coronata f. sp. avenae]|uniref:Secreted protein n=1 Tax=Puccinia coronata f. sp. avenae TaxID=200324 RepID=A0A2N5S7D2_9BASI|nr:hypothetical protein PCANC_25344 [Puccinia coronata f. sp. avenae]
MSSFNPLLFWLRIAVALSIASLASTYSSYSNTYCNTFEINPKGSEHAATCNEEMKCSQGCTSEIVGSDCNDAKNVHSSSQKCLNGLRVITNSAGVSYREPP